MKGIDFWSHEDGDVNLEFSGIGDAIYQAAESMDSADIVPGYMLTMYAYRLETANDAHRERMAARVVEYLTEHHLDENYGPDEEANEITEPMFKAGRVFVDEVLRHYKIVTCARVPEADQEIDLYQWCKAEAQELLEDPND